MECICDPGWQADDCGQPKCLEDCSGKYAMTQMGQCFKELQNEVQMNGIPYMGVHAAVAKFASFFMGRDTKSKNCISAMSLSLPLVTWNPAFQAWTCRHDIASTLMLCCINAMCPLGLDETLDRDPISV